MSIDMVPAFIKGGSNHLPNARITFDRIYVVWHASTAVDKIRRIEQRSDRSLTGMRWSLLKDRSGLSPGAAADLNALIAGKLDFRVINPHAAQPTRNSTEPFRIRPRL